MITNPIFEEFVALGLIVPEQVEKISDVTRDKEIPVYIDKSSKIIFLESVDTDNVYYEHHKTEDREGNRSLIQTRGGEVVETVSLEDSERRFRQFREFIEGRKICDFGTGYGDFLMASRDAADLCFGVELRGHCLEHLSKSQPDIPVKKSIAEFDEAFDLVTLFHVLEHIPYQVETLAEIGSKIAAGGRIIVEVPHSRDFLIQSLDIPAFREFTFWSEHLVLHTEQSLRRVLEESGFEDVTITPYQRYGFTNHLHWFLHGKPGGHEVFSDLENRELDQAYRQARESDFTCDTIIGIGMKP